MSVFILRDDDANATTDPARLARTYAPLFDAGIPVSFSVVPSVALDSRRRDGGRERFIDDAAPDCPEHRTLDFDAPLACWLRQNAALADVLLHGWSHRPGADGTEFGALDKAAAGDAMDRGREVLQAALGRSIDGFVAPWDRLSPGAFQAATERFGLISTAWVTRAQLPLRAWPAHIFERLRCAEALRVGQTWVLRHRGGRLEDHTAAGAVEGVVRHAGQGARVGVILLHHWMYWNRGEPHPAIRALADALRKRHVVQASTVPALLEVQRRMAWVA